MRENNQSILASAPPTTKAVWVGVILKIRISEIYEAQNRYEKKSLKIK